MNQVHFTGDFRQVASLLKFVERLSGEQVDVGNTSLTVGDFFTLSKKHGTAISLKNRDEHVVYDARELAGFLKTLRLKSPELSDEELASVASLPVDGFVKIVNGEDVERLPMVTICRVFNYIAPNMKIHVVRR